MTRSADASGRPVAPPSASTSGNSIPDSAMQRRAVSSWAGVMSTPTGRAPSLASQAETYAVPQPSSTASSPSTSPITPSSESGVRQMPQCGSPFQVSIALRSVYSALAFVQAPRFCAASSAQPIRFLPCDPQVLARPGSGPLDVAAVSRRRARRRPQLDQIVEDERVGAEQAQPVAIPQVERGAAAVLDIGREVEVRALQPVGLPIRPIVVTEAVERARDVEREQPGRTQEARDFGDDAGGVTPRERSMVGEDDVEARVG